MNNFLTHLLTKNITKLNKLIYAGEKLVRTKIGDPRKNTNRNSKCECKLDWKTQIINQRNKSEGGGYKRNNKEKPRQDLTIQIKKGIPKQWKIKILPATQRRMRKNIRDKKEVK